MNKTKINKFKNFFGDNGNYGCEVNIIYKYKIYKLL